VHNTEYNKIVPSVPHKKLVILPVYRTYIRVAIYARTETNLTVSFPEQLRYSGTRKVRF